MPQTLSRRRAFTGSAAVLAAMALPAMATPNPDAPLYELIEHWRVLRRQSRDDIENRRGMARVFEFEKADDALAAYQPKTREEMIMKMRVAIEKEGPDALMPAMALWGNTMTQAMGFLQIEGRA